MFTWKIRRVGEVSARESSMQMRVRWIVDAHSLQNIDICKHIPTTFRSVCVDELALRKVQTDAGKAWKDALVRELICHRQRKRQNMPTRCACSCSCQALSAQVSRVHATTNLWNYVEFLANVSLAPRNATFNEPILLISFVSVFLPVCLSVSLSSCCRVVVSVLALFPWCAARLGLKDASATEASAASHPPGDPPGEANFNFQNADARADVKLLGKSCAKGCKSALHSKLSTLLPEAEAAEKKALEQKKKEDEEKKKKDEEEAKKKKREDDSKKAKEHGTNKKANPVPATTDAEQDDFEQKSGEAKDNDEKAGDKEVDGKEKHSAEQAAAAAPLTPAGASGGGGGTPSIPKPAE